MAEAAFEGPAFKVIPKNESRVAKGHQSGFLIPIGLADFFPQLPQATAQNPTPSVPIFAELSVDGSKPILVKTRWQYQSWGGTRSPERRITGSLDHLISRSMPGDFLLIERSLTDDFHFRMRVVTSDTPEHSGIAALTDGKNSGFLLGSIVVSNEEIKVASNEIENLLNNPFSLTDGDYYTETTVRRMARVKAFRDRVCAAYSRRCAMCGTGLLSPHGLSEVEAAHIVPRSLAGTNDVRNGLSLCRQHHWAFDAHLIGIDSALRIRVAPKALALEQNASLQPLQGRLISVPQAAALAPHIDALNWRAAAFNAFWN